MSQVFGNKETFAIELKESSKPDQFFIRLWFNNNDIGDFKKSGSIRYLINSFFKYLNTKEGLYHYSFENKSDFEIFDDIVLTGFRVTTDEEREAELTRMKNYAFDFGDHQFNQFCFLILKKQKDLHLRFIITMSKTKRGWQVFGYNIEETDFLQVYNDVIGYLSIVSPTAKSILQDHLS